MRSIRRVQHVYCKRNKIRFYEIQLLWCKWLEASCGIAWTLAIEYTNDRFAILGFFDFEEGKIKNISGLSEALELQGVVDIGLDIKAGDVIKNAEDDRSRFGYYILKADTYQNLRNLENEMKSLIRIDYEGE